MSFNKTFRRSAYLVSYLVLLASFIPTLPVSAASLTSRKLTLSNSAASNAGTTYTFVFTAAAATTIKSVNIDICDSASGTCTPAGTGVPAGLTSTTAVLGSVTNIGSGGSWTATVSTNGRLRIANNSNTGSPSANITVPFTTITNPSISTFYARITTYSDAAWTTPIDTGTLAASTSTSIAVTAQVDESLTFCTGTSGITNTSCAGATGSTVALGSITPSSTGSGTSQIGIATNANSGYSITVNGVTLTSTPNTITALATQTASTQGSSQFGLNLKANTVPSVGTEVSGAGSATASANYATANQFRFVTGDTVASAASADGFRLFTVSYIANVAGNTPAGAYTTSLNYIATATF